MALDKEKKNILKKLKYLNSTKSQIRTSILNQNVSVSNTDTFRSYATKIDNIKSDDEQYEALVTEINTGKQAVAEAITNQGVTTSSSASYETMGNNILNIDLVADNLVGNLWGTFYSGLNHLDRIENGNYITIYEDDTHALLPYANEDNEIEFDVSFYISNIETAKGWFFRPQNGLTYGISIYLENGVLYCKIGISSNGIYTFTLNENYTLQAQHKYMLKLIKKNRNISCYISKDNTSDVLLCQETTSYRKVNREYVLGYTTNTDLIIYLSECCIKLNDNVWWGVGVQ